MMRHKRKRAKENDLLLSQNPSESELVNPKIYDSDLRR